VNKNGIEKLDICFVGEPDFFKELKGETADWKNYLNEE
jgi:hypothetical protein